MGPHICIFPNQSLRSWLWKMQIYGPTFYRSSAQEEIVILCFEMDCQCFTLQRCYWLPITIRMLLSVRSWVRRPSARPEPGRPKGRDGQLQPEARPIRVDVRRLHGGVAAVRPRLPLFLRLPSCRIVRPDEQYLRNQGNRTLYCVLWLDFLERDHFMTRN